MKEEILFSEPFLVIRHLPAQDMVVLRWKGYASPEDYRRGLETALDFVVAHRVKRWLADLRHMDAILAPEERWTNEHWFPRLIRSAVLQRMAILPSRDFFNQKSVERIMAHTTGTRSFHVGYFESEEEAMVWLFDRAADPVVTTA